MLIGHLGRDPEVRYTKGGDPVANFSVATSERYRGRDGQRQERTEWHNIVAFQKLAEFCKNYLRKGKQVYVEGRLQTSDWTDNNNVKRYRTEIIARSIQFVGPKTDGDSRTNYDNQQRSGGHYDDTMPSPTVIRPGSRNAPSKRRRSRTTTPPPNEQPPNDDQEADYMKDDIPF